MPFSPSYYITVDDNIRRAEAGRMHLPLAKDFGLRESKRTKLECDWKHHHKMHFDALGVVWPINWAKVRASMYLDGFLEREREVLILLDAVWGPPLPSGPYVGSVVFEFVGVNPTVQRLLGGCVDVDMQLDPNSKGPWRQVPPTLVGSGKLAVRITRPSSEESIVRIVESFELARMIGWGDEEWQHGAQSANEVRSVDFTELVANICGNAYSIFHYGPWQLAALATFGKFHKDLGGKTLVVSDDAPMAVRDSETYSESESD